MGLSRRREATESRFSTASSCMGLQLTGIKRETSMEYTAVIKRRGEWWIGWIEEVPGVNCQERSHGALHESLVETLSEALEFNRREALDAAGEDYQEERVVIA